MSAGAGTPPGGRGLIRRVLGSMFGPAAAPAHLSQEEVLVRRVYSAERLQDHLASLAHPGRLCDADDPEDRCHMTASSLHLMRWLAELSRLHDGLPEPIVAQTGQRTYRVAVTL